MNNNNSTIKFTGFGETVDNQTPPVTSEKEPEPKEFKPIIEEDTNIPRKTVITAEEMLKKEEPVEINGHNPFM